MPVGADPQSANGRPTGHDSAVWAGAGFCRYLPTARVERAVGGGGGFYTAIRVYGQLKLAISESSTESQQTRRGRGVLRRAREKEKSARGRVRVPCRSGKTW